MSSERGGRHELFFEIQNETVRRAVEPETETAAQEKSESRINEGEDEEDRKGVVVRSSDLRSLRAAVNGWRRLVSVAEETERISL